jgi:type VI secretion system protein ImpK
MRLSDCFIELMAYTAMVIRPDGGGQAAFEQVEADIRRLIAESEAKCQQGGHSSADYDLARFAVFAWIDETILSSNWEGKTAGWVNNCSGAFTIPPMPESCFSND